jgi:hypothetical protein
LSLVRNGVDGPSGLLRARSRFWRG